MNEINGFTFYRNYYELIKYLPEKERLQIVDAILKFMFENEETKFEGLLNGIWVNLKMPLESSKTNIKNGKKGGAPKGNNNAKKTTEKQPKNNRKTTERTTEKQANNISYFLFLISNFYLINNNKELKDKIIEYLEYKEERKEIYKEKGLNSLLVQIEKKAKEFGIDSVIDLITECMANNWKGIIWEKIKKPEKQLPTWFDKEIKQDESKNDELEKILEGF